MSAKDKMREVLLDMKRWVGTSSENHNRADYALSLLNQLHDHIIIPPHSHAETFKNISGLEFYDIDMEWREYEIVTGDGQMYVYRIDNPRKLHVSGSGHYVWDAEGVIHFIPASIFDVVRWKATSDGNDISIPEGVFNG